MYCRCIKFCTFLDLYPMSGSWLIRNRIHNLNAIIDIGDGGLRYRQVVTVLAGRCIHCSCPLLYRDITKKMIEKLHRCFNHFSVDRKKASPFDGWIVWVHSSFWPKHMFYVPVTYLDPPVYAYYFLYTLIKTPFLTC